VKSTLWAAIACVVGLGAQPAIAACQLQTLAELHVTVVDNQPLIDVEINGKPTRMLMDLGSESTLLFARGIDRLGIKIDPMKSRGTLTYYGVGGGAEAGNAHIDELKLGGSTKKNLDMLVLPGGGSGANDYVGLLGADFLTRFDLEFDFAHEAVRLFKPVGCSGDDVVYWGGAYSVVDGGATGLSVQVQLNGRTIDAIIDSGAYDSIVTSGVAQLVGATITKSDLNAAHGIGSKAVAIQVAHFTSFAFGDEKISNVALPIGDLFGADKDVLLGSRIPTQVIDAPDMLLGMDFMKAHRMYIAHSQKKVYVTYVGGPVFVSPTAPKTKPQP
jgi:predicted aspartyl protease